MEDRRFDHRVGRVLRPHGLRGDLVVQVFRPRRVGVEELKNQRVLRRFELELVDDVRELSKIVTLTRVRWLAPTRLEAHFAGIDDREEAERWPGAWVDVDPANLPEHLTDEVDRAFGATVMNLETGLVVGRVSDLRDNGAQALLVITTEEERELMVPFVDAFIDRIDEDDTGARTVHVRPIPGLLDLDERG